jgi:hypothetical protein
MLCHVHKATINYPTCFNFSSNLLELLQQPTIHLAAVGIFITARLHVHVHDNCINQAIKEQGKRTLPSTA